MPQTLPASKNTAWTRPPDCWLVVIFSARNEPQKPTNCRDVTSASCEHRVKKSSLTFGRIAWHTPWTRHFIYRFGSRRSSVQSRAREIYTWLPPACLPASSRARIFPLFVSFFHRPQNKNKVAAGEPSKHYRGSAIVKGTKYGITPAAQVNVPR